MTNYLKLKSLYSIRTYATVLIISALFFGMIAFLPVKTGAATNIPLCEITRSLKSGDSGEDVRCLQRFLNWSGYTLAATGPGSVGSESAYFGPLTANALIKWQNANAFQVLTPIGLTAGTGFWGPMSFNWYVSIVRNQLGLTS